MLLDNTPIAVNLNNIIVTNNMLQSTTYNTINYIVLDLSSFPDSILSVFLMVNPWLLFDIFPSEEK